MTESTKLFRELRERSGEAQVPDPDGHHLTTGVSNSTGDVRIFRELNGHIGLLIPLGATDPHRIAPDRESRAIILQMTSWTKEPSVEIRLQNPTLEDVFHAFVDSCLRKIAAEPERAGSIAASQLRSWRALFMPSSRKTLTRAEEIGLLCELEEMKLLLETDGEAAFYRWTGPDRQAHDFRFDDRGVECKATTLADGLHVTINGAHQLNPEPGRPLFLVVRKYEATPNGELSLKRVATELRQDDRVPEDLFLNKLQDMGFSLADQVKPGENMYRLRERAVFEVVDSFPRLHAADPSERIEKVSYGINLTPPEEVPGYRKDGSHRQ